MRVTTSAWPRDRITVYLRDHVTPYPTMLEGRPPSRPALLHVLRLRSELLVACGRAAVLGGRHQAGVRRLGHTHSRDATITPTDGHKHQTNYKLNNNQYDNQYDSTWLVTADKTFSIIVDTTKCRFSSILLGGGSLRKCSETYT